MGPWPSVFFRVDAVEDAGAAVAGGGSVVGDWGEEGCRLAKQAGPLAGEVGGEVNERLA